MCAQSIYSRISELVVGYFIFRNTSNLDGFNKILNTIFIIYLLMNFIPSIAALIRRLNDVNKSAINILFVLIPIIGWVYLIGILVMDGKEVELENVKD